MESNIMRAINDPDKKYDYFEKRIKRKLRKR